VKGCSKLRALGARHSFNGIADSTQDQISLAHLNQILLHRRGPHRHRGWGCHPTANWPPIWRDMVMHCTTWPRCRRFPSPARLLRRPTGQVTRTETWLRLWSAMEVVTADGEVLILSRERDGDRFAGSVVHLGAVGVVTKVTLDVQPTYQVAQMVYENLGMDQLEQHLEEIFTSGYSVRSLHRLAESPHRPGMGENGGFNPGVHPNLPLNCSGLSRQRKASPARGPFGGELQPNNWAFPAPGMTGCLTSASALRRAAGPSCSLSTLSPGTGATKAILAIEQLRDHVTPHLFISEVRTIAADNLWMSTAYKRDSMGIHFTWKPEWPGS